MSDDTAYRNNLALHISTATLKARRRLDKPTGDLALGWLGAVAIVAAVLILVMG